jgi:hypothetical protein
MTRTARMIGSLALLLCVLSACDKPKPAGEQPAPNAAPAASAQTQVNPAGPLYFEARDAKPSYLVALKAEGSDNLLLTIQPQGAYKINAAFPISLKLEDGAVYDSEQFKVSEKEGSLSLAGKKPEAVKGLLKFGVCTAEHCETQQVQITTTPSPTHNKTSEVTL